jgi:hypothetical protein
MAIMLGKRVCFTTTSPTGTTLPQLAYTIIEYLGVRLIRINFITIPLTNTLKSEMIGPILNIPNKTTSSFYQPNTITINQLTA